MSNVKTGTVPETVAIITSDFYNEWATSLNTAKLVYSTILKKRYRIPRSTAIINAFVKIRSRVESWTKVR